MSGETLGLEYLLARTVIRIDGTIAVDTTDIGARVATRTSQVTLGVEGDYDTPACAVRFDSQWWAKKELAIELAADGRLSGGSHSSEGVGGELVGTAISVTTTALKLASSILGLVALPETVRTPAQIDEDLRSENDELATRRTSLQQLIRKLENRLDTLADALADAAGRPSPEDAEALKAVQGALAGARSEAAIVDASFERWRAKRYPTWTSTRTYLVGTDQLLNREAVEPSVRVEPDELRGQAAEAAATLGVVIVRVGEDPTRHSPPESEDDELVYRLPERVTLAVYEARDAAAEAGDGKAAQPATFELRSVVQAWVVDSMSRHASVPLRNGFFAKNGATVAFGDAGTLTKLSSAASSGVSTALAGAGGAVTGGLDVASKISAAVPTAADPELKALQQQVDRKELEAKLVTANKTIANGPGV